MEFRLWSLIFWSKVHIWVDWTLYFLKSPRTWVVSQVAAGHGHLVETARSGDLDRVGDKCSPRTHIQGFELIFGVSELIIWVSELIFVDA